MRIGKLSRFGRVSIVSIALLANLIAAGVPVLHAFAHEWHAHTHHEDVHDTAATTDGSNEFQHPHDDEVHPTALHEDGQLLPRASVDFGGIAQPEPIAALFVVISSDRSSLSKDILLSRAPPGDAAARAPPLP